MRALKKVLAITCSAAAVIGMAASAISALAFDPVDLDDRASELKNGVTNLVADEVYAEPGETVSFRVMVKNNAGYGPSGFSLTYDSALQPVMEDNGVKPALKWGDGSYGLTKSYTLNADKHLIGFSTVGTDNCEKDGIIYTAQFVVPANAEEGAEYPLSLKVDKFLDAKTDPVSHNDVNGWIRIKKPAATMTTASVSSGTTTTTSEGSKIDTATTTTVTVTTPIETDVSTVSNTSKTNRDPGTEPTTASRAGSVTATTKKPGSSSTTTATKTGDAGVGVAAAGLMLAGAAAVICKKKEH